MPQASVEDEGLGLMLGDEPAPAPPTVYRRTDALDDGPRGGRPKVIVVSVSATFDFFHTEPLCCLASRQQKGL